MKKIKINNEATYFFAIILIAFSVAMIAAADLGVSMVVAPAYILSLKFSFLTFGQWEYVLQGILFAVFCIIKRKVKLVYFTSFLNCIVYGAVLDMFRTVIPMFNPNITPAGSFAMPLRIAMLGVGMVLTSFAVALFFKAYLYPQVYDFFVKGVAAHFKLDRGKFKICYDLSSLTLSCILSLVLFAGFKGVGIGTLIMALVNGLMISFFDKLLTKYVEFTPAFKKLAKAFDLEG